MNKDLHILNAKLKSTLHSVDAFSDAARAASEISRRSMGWPGLSQTWQTNDDDDAARRPKLPKKEVDTKSWSDFLKDLKDIFKGDAEPSIPAGEPSSWSPEDAENLVGYIEDTLDNDSVNAELLNELNQKLFEYSGANPQDSNAAQYLELLNSEQGLGNPELQKNVSGFEPVDITDSTVPNDFQAAVDNFAEFEKDLSSEEYESNVSDLLDAFDQLSPSQKEAAAPELLDAFPDPNNVTDPRTNLSVSDAIDVSSGGRGDGSPDFQSQELDYNQMLDDLGVPNIEDYSPRPDNLVPVEEYYFPSEEIPSEPRSDTGRSSVIMMDDFLKRQEENNDERAEQQFRSDTQQRLAQEFEDMDSGTVSQENLEELQRRSERMQQDVERFENMRNDPERADEQAEQQRTFEQQQRAAQEWEDAQPQERLAYDVSKLVEMDQGSDSSDPKRETFNNQLADILDGIEGEPPAAADTLRRRLRNDFPDIENFIDPRTGNEISESPGFGDDQD